jgi:hypothetical protein
MEAENALQVAGVDGTSGTTTFSLDGLAIFMWCLQSKQSIALLNTHTSPQAVPSPGHFATTHMAGSGDVPHTL